jgi:hypothetical protein
MVTGIQTDRYSRVAGTNVGSGKHSRRWLLAEIAITGSRKTRGSLLRCVVRTGATWISHQGHEGMVRGGSASISVAPQSSSGGQDLFVLLSDFFLHSTLNFVVDKLVGKAATERHGSCVDLNLRVHVLKKSIF